MENEGGRALFRPSFPTDTTCYIVSTATGPGPFGSTSMAMARFIPKSSASWVDEAICTPFCQTVGPAARVIGPIKHEDLDSTAIAATPRGSIYKLGRYVDDCPWVGMRG